MTTVYAYVPNYLDETVSVIDTSTNTVSATITVGTSPNGVAITPDGSMAYIANGGSSGVVSVIDTSTKNATATISVGEFPTGIAITPDGSTAYVLTQGYGLGTGYIYVVDTATNSVL